MLAEVPLGHHAVVTDRQARGSATAPRLRLVPDPTCTTERVVHLVGRLTDQVFSFLGPATAALATEGVSQTIILLDHPAGRHLLPRLHASVRLVLLPSCGGLRGLAASAAALRQSLINAPGSIVHLHGVVPSLLGVYVIRVLGAPAGALYCSPHGSRSLGPLRGPGAALLRLLRPFSGRRPQRAIANAAADALQLEQITRASVDLIESPIDPAFFEAEANAARRPLIVTGQRAHSPRSAAFFAQLAVLLSEQSLQISFNWIGTADDESLARLAAANVKVIDETDTEQRARCLAAGWIFVAPGGTLGFPVHLAEAMSTGLPIVAWDSPYHRDVLTDGVTGFLCTSEAAMIERVRQLLDSPELRHRLGLAARAEARERFNGQRFRTSVLAAYRIAQHDRAA